MSERVELITAIAVLLRGAAMAAARPDDRPARRRHDIRQLMRRSRSWKVFGVEGEFRQMAEDLADSTSMPGVLGPGLDAI